jgi:hypothetical protein
MPFRCSTTQVRISRQFRLRLAVMVLHDAGSSAELQIADAPHDFSVRVILDHDPVIEILVFHGRYKSPSGHKCSARHVVAQAKTYEGLDINFRQMTRGQYIK